MSDFGNNQDGFTNRPSEKVTVPKPQAERCVYCDEPTGKAGIGEDSNYLGTVGPYCDKHHEEIRNAVYTDVLDSYDGLTPTDVTAMRDEARRFYNADGSHETLDSAEAVKAKRKACAKELEDLRAVVKECAEAFEGVNSASNSGGENRAETDREYNALAAASKLNATLTSKGGE